MSQSTCANHRPSDRRRRSEQRDDRSEDDAPRRSAGRPARSPPAAGHLRDPLPRRRSLGLHLPRPALGRVRRLHRPAGRHRGRRSPSRLRHRPSSRGGRLLDLHAVHLRARAGAQLPDRQFALPADQGVLRHRRQRPDLSPHLPGRQAFDVLRLAAVLCPDGAGAGRVERTVAGQCGLPAHVLRHVGGLGDRLSARGRAADPAGVPPAGAGDGHRLADHHAGADHPAGGLVGPLRRPCRAAAERSRPLRRPVHGSGRRPFQPPSERPSEATVPTTESGDVRVVP